LKSLWNWLKSQDKFDLIMTVYVVLMLIVIFFHSFVLVPKVHATAFEGTLARILFRSISPATVMGLGSNMSLVLGIPVAAGIGYLVYKSGAIDTIKSWFQSTQQTEPTYVQGGTYYGVTGRSIVPVVPPCGSSSFRLMLNGVQEMVGCDWAQQDLSNWLWPGGYTPPSPPSVPTDYSADLSTSQPNFSSTAVYGSPGVAGAINSSSVAVSVATMTDSEADSFIAGLGGVGATGISDTGVQQGIPETNDNTVTSGDLAQVGLLQQILNFVSNLVGIKNSTETISRTLDNSLAVQQTMVDKLDNVGVFPVPAQNALDNIVVGVNNQTAILEDVKIGVESLDNTVTQVNATPISIQTRIDALRDIAVTKFPFSIAFTLGVSSISGQSTYEFASLPLTPTLSIPINPMAGPLSTLFGWIRQMIVWLFWVGTLLAILRKGMSM